jgi:uncharacterized membrane protein
MDKENKSKKTLKEIEETKRAFQERTITLILGGFGLVAALAWNEAIRSLFETVFKTRGTIISKFIYAIIVTLMLVIISLQLQKINRKSR